MRRWPLLIILFFVVLLQYPLWLGKGGWFRVWEAEADLEARQQENARLEARNAALAAEVRDLKSGLDAVEERARYNLGLIGKDEIFIHIPEQKMSAPPAPRRPAAAPPASKPPATPLQ